MRMTVVMPAVSNLRQASPRKLFTAATSSRLETWSERVTVKCSPATARRPRALNSSLRAFTSASWALSARSALPIASASASFERLWNLLKVFAAWAMIYPLGLG